MDAVLLAAQSRTGEVREELSPVMAAVARLRTNSRVPPELLPEEQVELLAELLEEARLRVVEHYPEWLFLIHRSTNN